MDDQQKGPSLTKRKVGIYDRPEGTASRKGMSALSSSLLVVFILAILVVLYMLFLG